MGYRCRWIAMRGRERAGVLASLKFAVTAEVREEIYDPGLYAVEIDGWLVLMGDGWDFMELVPRRLAQKLSASGEVLYFYTDDTPMKAEITSFVDGRAQWSITFDDAVATEGTPPALVGDDPYDAIAELGLALVGFRHDRTLGEGKHLPVYQLKN